MKYSKYVCDNCKTVLETDKMEKDAWWIYVNPEPITQQNNNDFHNPFLNRNKTIKGNFCTVECLKDYLNKNEED